MLLANDGVLVLKFPIGRRPDATTLNNAVKKLEFVSVLHSSSDQDEPIELLSEGMIFELYGICPAQAATFEYFPSDPGELALNARSDAIVLAPGPHIAAGVNTVPILRRFMEIGAALSDMLPHLEAIRFKPSACDLPPADFVAAIKCWSNGGNFPVPAMISFKSTLDEAFQSRGLAFHNGQELRLEPDTVEELADPLSLGNTLINFLVQRERLSNAEVFTDGDGASYMMKPSANGKTIRVSAT